MKEKFSRYLLCLLAGCLLLVFLSGTAIATDSGTAKPVAELYVTSW